ncbi:MAG: D-cysteine desulfhydrase family protein [Holophagales bacterium]|nr:D-cysteine desulfhydrase family protein [Holophagales bacterium]
MTKDGDQALREALGRFERLGLAKLPTPLERLDRLTDYLGGPEIWIKREDLTGLGLGGNKTRKLDFVLREAVDTGRDVVVSGGVIQSNSQRQVAAAAAKLGLECHLAVFRGRVTPPSPEYEWSGNALLNRLFGAHLHEVPWTGDRIQAIDLLGEQLEAGGRKPFIVPYGASCGPGAVGYAAAALEIAEQCRSSGLEPSAVVLSSGSGGTQAGLTTGLGSCSPNTRVVGIDIDAEPARVRADVVKHAQAAAELLGVEFAEERVEVVAGLAGPGYGMPHEQTLEAIHLAARLEGLVMDPVYSGKGLAGLISLIRSGRWRRGEAVVFVHTGGEPAVFAYGPSLGIEPATPPPKVARPGSASDSSLPASAGPR